MLALRSCASALIVQQLIEAEGFAWALILSFRFISEIVGFSSGVSSSELLGFSSGMPCRLWPWAFRLCNHGLCSEVMNFGSEGQMVEQSGGL